MAATILRSRPSCTRCAGLPVVSPKGGTAPRLFQQSGQVMISERKCESARSTSEPRVSMLHV
eukprot:8335078-Pyramimonas_sp.AAC.1